MKTIFPGHYFPSNADWDLIWRDCIFALDASVLLNLYRYTEATSEDLFAALTRLSGRLWLPHQSAIEFQRNRPAVILQLAETYSGAQEYMAKVVADVKSKFAGPKHPLTDPSLLLKLTEIEGMFRADLARRKAQREAVLARDLILERLTKLFDGKVGDAFGPAELEQVVVEAKDRFARKIPPGYKDAGEKGDGREFGDVILWKQVIRKAQQHKRPIVLITDDEKEDWWWIVKKRRLAARPELAAEFYREAGVAFGMYDSPSFLEEAKNRLAQPVMDATLREVHQVRAKRRGPNRRKRPLDARPIPVQLEVLRRREAELAKLLKEYRDKKLDRVPSNTWPGVIGHTLTTVLTTMLENTRQKKAKLSALIEDKPAADPSYESHPSKQPPKS